MRLALLLVIMALAVVTSLSAGARGPLVGPRFPASTDFAPNDPSYQLVWSDEFDQPDGSAPDPSIWNFETGGNGEGNHELEYYTDRRNNSFIENGRLVIQGLAEQYKGHNYTSARLDTAGKVSFYLGYIAARARVAPGMIDGGWPAFWMLGDQSARVNWPRCGEQDIMEQVNGRGTGGQDNSLQFGTLHYSNGGENGTQPVHNSTGGIIKQKPGHYWADEFHVYGALWTESSYTFLVDDLAYETIDLTSKEGYDSFTDPANPFFFIINLALGGDFPRRIPNPKQLPIRLEVDWVRVWQTDSQSSSQAHVQPKMVGTNRRIKDVSTDSQRRRVIRQAAQAKARARVAAV